MAKKMQQKKNNRRTFSTKEKGSIVEAIVAEFHQEPGINVERNVFLVPVSGGRKREIDVLITTMVAGYQIRIAFECKNEKRKIGVDKIDSFIGKLKHIGIPIQHGIYVSSSGYTTDAKKRAKADGLRCLNLIGLNNDGLRNKVAKAIQSIIHILAEVETITITSNQPRISMPGDSEFLFDHDGKFCGMISTVIWNAWVTGKIPESLGKHQLEIILPENWHMNLNNVKERPTKILVTMQVAGLVLSIPGKMEKYSLLDEISEDVTKTHRNIEFDKIPKKANLTAVLSETELGDYIKRERVEAVLLTRIKLPRILNGPIYWPPSERVYKKVIKLMQEHHAGNIPDPRPLNFQDIEGSDINAVFEPIYKGFIHHENEVQIKIVS